MRVAPCPSCGAQVEFHSAASVMAVCAFCRSTLVRRDMDLESLGKMAELAEDHSPFALRYRGAYHKVGYALIGRLQLQYPDGYWNEWYAQFDDGRFGWISEGSGLCYVTFEQAIKNPLPAFEAIQLGQEAKLGGQDFTVTNIEHATCVAVEGELPFQAMPGYDAPAVDLRSAKGFASLDYSETPPRFYLGEAVTLDALLDKAAPNAPKRAKRAQARDFKCTSCGAPLTVRSGDIRAIGCGHCGAVIDPLDPNLAILSRAVKQLEQPLLALGGQGKLLGHDYTIIGWLKRHTEEDGNTYFWDEYLLHSPEKGYAWLSESQGHWSFGEAMTRQPHPSKAERPKVLYEKREYRHFEHYTGVVDQVLGEFTWRVKIGETVQIDDYIAPPYLLTREQSDREITWTKSVYVEMKTVTHAFPPQSTAMRPVGIAPNQPGLTVMPFWKLYGLLVVLAIVLQGVFVARSDSQVVWRGDVEIPEGSDKQTLTTTPFHLGRGIHNLVVYQHAEVNNSWVDSDIMLTNIQTGMHLDLQRELSFYAGTDSDGTWSEGSRYDDATFGHLPEGDYIAGIEAESENKPDRPAVIDHIELRSHVPIWVNFWLLQLALLLFPVIAMIHYGRFETRRWAESSYGKP